ncbi:MAG: MFS transporter [Myxococcota bacterium]
MFDFERIRNKDIFRIYAITLCVGLAYGISISLTAVYLDSHGVSKEDIGTLAAWFAGGLMLASVPMGWLIRKLSARWVLCVGLLGYAACISAFPWLDSYTSLAVVRFFDGAFSVAVWIACETLLLALAEPEHKAFTTSLYAISLAVGYVIGPLAARGIAELAPLTLAFAAAGLVSVAAAVYTLLGLQVRALGHTDERKASGEAPNWAVLYKIKASCFAAFAYGYFEAAVVLFLPIYLMESKGITRDQTIVIPAFFAAGMLLFSNVAGRFGDRAGHLLVMRGLSIVGTAMILGFVFADAYALMCVLVFIAGASLGSISPVSLALQGAQCSESEYSRATSLYNTFYAAGILLGPPLSSQLFARAGGALMLYHLAALWGAFILFSVVFARDDPRARGALVPNATLEREP